MGGATIDAPREFAGPSFDGTTAALIAQVRAPILQNLDACGRAEHLAVLQMLALGAPATAHSAAGFPYSAEASRRLANHLTAVLAQATR